VPIKLFDIPKIVNSLFFINHMMPARQTLNLSDFQLSYLEWNQGKEPLLLLHGLGNHGLVWSSLGDYLSDRYHIVAVDMRGHGYSSKPETGYTFEEAIADLEALLDHLGWQSTHIVAHSWCGKLAPSQETGFLCKISVSPPGPT
jgi:pimeloyl-ACP methyl ester carboxylesterase